MPDQPTVEVTLNMSAEEAWALAQFIKRVTYTSVRECAVDDAETRLMLDSFEIVRRALAEVGIAPR